MADHNKVALYTTTHDNSANIVYISQFSCVQEVNKLHVCLVQGRLHKTPGNNGIPVAGDPFLSVGPPFKVYNVNTPSLVMIDVLQHDLILAYQLLLVPIQRCIVVHQGWFV